MPDQTIWGGMPRPADLRYSQNNNTPWVTFTVADSARYKDDQGQWQSKDESYIDVVLWGAEAELVAQFEKGTQVACLGRFVTRKFEKDGQQRSVLQFKATKVAQVVRAGASAPRTSPAPATSQPAADGTGDVWGAPGAQYDQQVPF